MKNILIALLFLTSNYYFGQNDLEIKILNDTIKRVPILIKIILCTQLLIIHKNYLLVLDNEEFNEDPEYTVEPFFIGLPDYYLYEKKYTFITNVFFLEPVKPIVIPQFDLSSEEFQKFRRQF